MIREARYAVVLDNTSDPENAWYDIVWRERGRIDRVLARRARHDDAVIIVEGLNLREDQRAFEEGNAATGVVPTSSEV